MKTAIAILSLILSFAAFADLTPEEAAAKLRERDAARKAAASQPTTLTQAEVDRMRAELAQIKAQLAAVKAENEKLKAAIAKTAKLDAKENTKQDEEGSLAADGPGVYRFVWFVQPPPGVLPAGLKNHIDIEARSRAVAISIAVRQDVELEKRFDVDGHEIITNCRKIKDLDIPPKP